MFVPIARSYKVYDMAAGDVLDQSPTTGWGHHFPDFIEVFSNDAADAEIIIGENYHGGKGFPIPANSGSRYIMVRASRIEVKGADVKVIAYFI